MERRIQKCLRSIGAYETLFAPNAQLLELTEADIREISSARGIFEENTALMKSTRNPSMYFLFDNEKYHIVNQESFHFCQFGMDQIQVVDPAIDNAIPKSTHKIDYANK